MKLLNATFEIENDLSEYKLRQHLESINAKYIKTLPCTEHLKEDNTYKLLKKEERKAKEATYRYINTHRI